MRVRTVHPTASHPPRLVPSIVRACVGACLALPALLLLSPTASAALHPSVRDGWFVGLGFGGGTAAITVDGESSDREGGTAGSFRAGYALDPRFALGFEGNLWFKSEGGVDFTLSTYTAALSFFPAEGLVLRAGIGGGDAEAEVQEGNTTVTATETGFGVTVGAEYELRVARSFALGPQLDFAYVNVDSFDANYVNFGLAFTWYFIPT